MKIAFFKLCLVLGMSIALAACGSSASVQGNTYEGGGGAVKIEFQSGGKAIASVGSLSRECTYIQDGKKITLKCESDQTDFTVNDDGSLSGPQDGLMARLTKKQT